MEREQEQFTGLSILLDQVVSGLSLLRPELVLVLTFLLSILSGLFLSRVKFATSAIVLVGLCLSLYFSWQQCRLTGTIPLFGDMLLLHVHAAKIKLLLLLSALIAMGLFAQSKFFRQHEKGTSDLLSVLVALVLGLHVWVMASNWLMVYVAIEMVSVASYILVGYLSASKPQAEAALKYVVFGTVCSAFMLYGLSLLYGLTGSLALANLGEIALAEEHGPMLALSLVMVFAGLGFKLSIVPFHFWSPDIYQGAPPAVVALLSTAPKIAAVAFLINLLNVGEGLPEVYYAYLRQGLMLLALLTMLVGNLAALRQDKLKRLMAYSSIGHTGFVLMLVLADPVQGFEAIYFYLFIYLLTNMGVFLLLGHLEERHGIVQIVGLKGWGKVYPAWATGFSVMMVSLTGLPPTAGFTAKLLVFAGTFAAYRANGEFLLLLLLITGALTTVISLFFYFKIPLNLFLKEGQVPQPTSGWKVLAALCVLFAFLLLLFGLFPSLLDLFMP